MKFKKFSSGVLLFSNLCFLANSNIVWANGNNKCSVEIREKGEVPKYGILAFLCGIFRSIINFFSMSSNDESGVASTQKKENDLMKVFANIKSGDDDSKNGKNVPILNSEGEVISSESLKAEKSILNDKVQDENNVCRSEEDILREMNIADLAKDEKYKKGILKAIYTCLFLWEIQLSGGACPIDSSFFFGFKKSGKSIFYKFLKNLEKNDLLVRDRLYKRKNGSEFFDYIESIRFITKSGKRLIARFIFDNIDSLGGSAKYSIYNMYWHRSAGEESINFGDFVKDLNFSSEQADTVAN